MITDGTRASLRRCLRGILADAAQAQALVCNQTIDLREEASIRLGEIIGGLDALIEIFTEGDEDEELAEE